MHEIQETWGRFRGWEDPLEKEMATHSSILAWKIPWTEEPGGLPSMGSQGIRHDWAQHSNKDEAKPSAQWHAINWILPTMIWVILEAHYFSSKSLGWASQVAQWSRVPLQCRRCRRHLFDPWVGKIPCKRKWQLTLVFLPAKSHEQRSLEE